MVSSIDLRDLRKNQRDLREIRKHEQLTTSNQQRNQPTTPTYSCETQLHFFAYF
jgi:hypothetical protein